MHNFPDTNRQKVLEWMTKYLVDENFPMEHLDAIAKIVSHFNEDEQTESNIFGFANKLDRVGPGVDIFVGDKVFTLKVISGQLKINSKEGVIVVKPNAANSINLDQEDF